MVIWEPWHVLEYHRIHAKGQQTHAYTERVEDNGWKLIISGMTREQWFTTYTRACAEDFLERRCAPKGTYVIAVYRTGRSPDGDRLALGSIRIKWRVDGLVADQPKTGELAPVPLRAQPGAT
jgi:hypothetical protein